MDLIIKKCHKCGAMVEVINDCSCDNCGIKCCGEQMTILDCQTNDESHIINYKKVDNEIIVTINPDINDSQYIKWVALVSDKKIGKKFVNPNDSLLVTFPYEKGSKIYAYSTKYGLFSTMVK